METPYRWFIEPRRTAVNERLAEFLTSLGIILPEGVGTAEGAADHYGIPRSAFEFPGFLLTRILDRVWSDKEFKVCIYRKRGKGPLEECAFLLKRPRRAPRLVKTPPRASAAA